MTALTESEQNSLNMALDLSKRNNRGANIHHMAGLIVGDRLEAIAAELNDLVNLADVSRSQRGCSKWCHCTDCDLRDDLIALKRRIEEAAK